MREQVTTAAEMARAAGVDPKAFRHRLRQADLSWHRHGDFWAVVEGDDHHRDMVRVLEAMLA